MNRWEAIPITSAELVRGQQYVCVCGLRESVRVNLCTAIIMKQTTSEKEHMCPTKLPRVNKVNTYTQQDIGGDRMLTPTVLPGCQKPSGRCLSFMASA